MSVVTLVRHGQANSLAQDEHSYDRLSDLGIEQVNWLGQYLARSDPPIRRLVCGTMQRQRQTALAIAEEAGVPIEEDPRLNELDYFSLSREMETRLGATPPTDRASFLRHMPEVMKAWSMGKISCPGEDFAEFEARVLASLADAEAVDGSFLITSGGVIGMALRQVLGLHMDAFAHVLLQVNNSSLHRYAVEFGERRLQVFNATPHLDATERAHARTYI